MELDGGTKLRESPPFTFDSSKIITSGAYGEIYFGNLTDTGTPICLKIAKNRFDPSFDREFILLDQLRNRDGIVHTYGFAEVSSRNCIVLERADGALQDLLKLPRHFLGLPMWTVLNLVEDLAKALNVLISEKIAHRDIKPMNILYFSKHNTPGIWQHYTFKLCDFGFGRSVLSMEQSFNSNAGTTHYMAPQMLVKQLPHLNIPERISVNAQITDLWSLGITLYECVTGKLPFNPQPLTNERLYSILTERPNDRVVAHHNDKWFLDIMTTMIQSLLYRRNSQDIAQMMASLAKLRSRVVFNVDTHEFYLRHPRLEENHEWFKARWTLTQVDFNACARMSVLNENNEVRFIRAHDIVPLIDIHDVAGSFLIICQLPLNDEISKKSEEESRDPDTNSKSSQSITAKTFHDLISLELLTINIKRLANAIESQRAGAIETLTDTLNMVPRAHIDLKRLRAASTLLLRIPEEFEMSNDLEKINIVHYYLQHLKELESEELTVQFDENMKRKLTILRSHIRAARKHLCDTFERSRKLMLTSLRRIIEFNELVENLKVEFEGKTKPHEESSIEVEINWKLREENILTSDHTKEGIIHLDLARDASALSEELNFSQEFDMRENLKLMLKQVQNLNSLDLSYWNSVGRLRSLRPHFFSLTTLTLHDVPNLSNALDNICLLTELKLLDISQSDRNTGIYSRPATALYKLISSLKCLTHLDISSTNLTAQPTAKEIQSLKNSKHFAPEAGLRFHRPPLYFLGIFNCDVVSDTAPIAAITVAGTTTEEQACDESFSLSTIQRFVQIVTALSTYVSRAPLLRVVLQKVSEFYKVERNDQLLRCEEALDLVLQRMVDQQDLIVLREGIAALISTMRRAKIDKDSKEHIMDTVLSIMEFYIAKQSLVEQSCHFFEVFQSEIHEYTKIVRKMAILLPKLLHQYISNEPVLTTVLFLLKIISCNGGKCVKTVLGYPKTTEIVLELIAKQQNTNSFNGVVEWGWKFIASISDDTPINCKRLINTKVLHHLEQCCNLFEDKTVVMTELLILCSNIAEVDFLRTHLMLDSLIDIFKTSLLNESTSYVAAAIFSQLLSTGTSAWDIVSVDREVLIDAVMRSSFRWKLHIKYRSLHPVISLLTNNEAYASQYWSVWTLSNLTSTDRSKYCKMIVDEEGGEILVHLISQDEIREETKELARKVLENIESWKTENADEEGEAQWMRQTFKIDEWPRPPSSFEWDSLKCTNCDHPSPVHIK